MQNEISDTSLKRCNTSRLNKKFTLALNGQHLLQHKSLCFYLLTEYRMNIADAILHQYYIKIEKVTSEHH